MPDVYDSVGGENVQSGENAQGGENAHKRIFAGFGVNPPKVTADFTAATTTNEKSKMTLKVNTGTQVEPVYKNRIFNNINPSSNNGDFLSIGQALGALQTYTLESVNRTNTFDLVAE